MTGGTVEEANTEILFQGLDLKRDSGLSEKELLRCFVKAQLLSNRAKHFQTKVFQLGHVIIIRGNRPTMVSIIEQSNSTSRTA